MVNRVAAAVDGSPASMAAVQYAVQLVAPEGMLMLVDVQDVMSFYHDCFDDSITGDVSCDVAYFMKAWNEQSRKERGRGFSQRQAGPCRVARGETAGRAWKTG